MIQSLHIAAGGLRAAAVRAEAAAGKIARAGTVTPIDASGYAVYGTQVGAVQPGQAGSQAGNAFSRTPPVPVFWPGHPDANGDGVVGIEGRDLASSIVDLKLAKHAYEANAKVMRTAGDMLGFLVDEAF